MLDQANVNIIQSGNDEDGYTVINLFSYDNGNALLVNSLETAKMFSLFEEKYKIHSVGRIIKENIDYWSRLEAHVVKDKESAYSLFKEHDIDRVIITFDLISDELIIYYPYDDYAVLDDHFNEDIYIYHDCEKGIISRFSMYDTNSISEFHLNQAPINDLPWDIGEITSNYMLT